MQNGYLNFDEYIIQGEPNKKAKAEIWRTAIGLQAVDGLQTSDYLKDTACKHIEGEINIDEVCERIRTYYLSKTKLETEDEDMQEADKVSANIAKILSSDTLDFSTNGYLSLHRRIFDGVFKHAGQVRHYDITKKEWILDNDTVHYLNWEDLLRALNYDIEQERSFSYKGISTEQLINHITNFVSKIWQIHPFAEGNTRTTAVFTILYLRDLGFKVENDMFAEHSWYFRNALVRANYRNAVKGIDYTLKYLERFFRNLLFNEQWELKNRYLHISPTEEWKKQPNLQENRTSTGQVQDKLFTKDNNIISLIKLLYDNQMSVKEMMEGLNLKGRDNFLNLYLSPAIKEGYVCLLYSDKPRHPRQKYLLTSKGIALYNEVIKF